MCDKIFMFLHADGYVIDDVFECRELTFIFPDGLRKSFSSFFKISDMPGSNTEIENSEKAFEEHGLAALGGNMISLMLSHVIMQFIHDHKSKKRPFIAINDHKYLARILDGLKVKYIDLKDLGCPRFEMLPLEEKVTCGKHLKNKRCGQAIVKAYMNWTEKK